MRIINTGGTFNKRYDLITGALYVPKDNGAVESIVESFVRKVSVEGIIYKDSLEMDDQDRQLLAEAIRESSEKIIIVVHGTDTMDLSAQAVSAAVKDKVVVFTGAMVPFSIDPLEATANLSMAIGYAYHAEVGVYIVMQGIAGTFTQIKKNKAAGKFEYA